MNRLIRDIRKAHPKLAARRDMAAAIELHCLECVGDDRREAETCSDDECPLHPFRPGREARQRAEALTPEGGTL